MTTLVMGFFLRVGLIVSLRTSGLGESVFHQLDAESYDRIAWDLARAWRGEQPFDLLATTQHVQIGYYYFVAALYLVVGHSVFTVQIVNSLLGVCTAYLMYLLALRYTDVLSARVVMVLACFFPSLLFWSTQNLKDPLVFFLLCIVVLGVSRFSEDGRPGTLVIVLLAATALSTLRTYLFFLVGASLVISFLWGDTGRRRPAWNCALAGGTLAVLLCAFFFYQSFGALTWNYLASPSFKSIQRIRESTAGGRSSFFGHVDISSLPRALLFAPVGLAYAALGPWPFASGSVLYKMALPEMILWYLVLPVAACGGVALRLERRRGALFVIFLAITTLVSLGIVQSNMGTLLRQRGPVVLLVFLLAGAGLSAVGREGHPIQPLLKRGLDIAGAVIGLLFLGPIMLLIAMIIRATSGTQVLYTQERLGKDGVTFRLLKFRTMRPGPDPDGTEYSVEHDPRITPIGRWLRRYSLDELPQLWNVLRGDMSLVGPRPMRPELYERWSPFVDKRLKARPGLTGWQQVNGRNSLTWEAILVLDAWYVDHASFWLDLKILWWTIGVVLSGEGLYFGQSKTKDTSRRSGRDHE